MTAANWAGRRVLVTGHTGFKGSWLSLWLAELGAEVTGFALAPEVGSLFAAAHVADRMTHIEGDIRHPAAVDAAVAQAQPEIVFHLAAQALVRPSYDDPVGTYATNVMGTVNVLDAVRRQGGVRAVVAVTSDKCYENREWVWPYRESDPMGGHDPYSSSKGCAELVVAAYRTSFFHDGTTLVASARAGNVIGGGDHAKDRLIPDIMRAFEAGQRPLIRAPNAVRPWQHVLDALSGYLALAERLLAGDRTLAEGWNFGPAETDTQPVGWIADRMVDLWGADGWDRVQGPQPHEANLLKLDCSKAQAHLGWRPALTLTDALDRVVAWHRAVASDGNAQLTTIDQISAYRTLRSGALGKFGTDDG